MGYTNAIEDLVDAAARSTVDTGIDVALDIDAPPVDPMQGLEGPLLIGCRQGPNEEVKPSQLPRLLSPKKKPASPTIELPKE